ncbi:MAG TPA: hypothetical protein VHZ73_14100 [Vicinamibacterales bacterium]|jgi:hypothetical protein|nr:hypothetical protein [Vicinamibacterales bacterium]
MQRNAAWAAAIALGAAALGLQLAPAALAPALSCPGLLESAGVAAAQIARGAPFGLWLIRADRVIFFATILLFSRAALLASGSWLATGAITLAFAASPLFAPAMSPFDPFVAGAASLAAFLALRGFTGRRQMVPWGVGTCLVAIALAIPLVTVPAWVLPPLPPAFAGPAAACGMSSPGSAGAAAVLSSVGTYGLMLGAFGLFTVRAKLGDRRAWPLVVYAGAAFLVAYTRGGSPARTLTPAVVATWLCAATGLAEVARAVGPGVRGQMGAAVFAVLVLAVPIAARFRVGQASPALASTFGHDRMTLDGMRRALQALPPKSILVSEDAVTDLLLRASTGTWQRSGKMLRTVDKESSALATAVSDPAWQVFALPAAQADLPKQGFELSDGTLPGMTGLSLVKSGGVCRSIGEAWVPIDFAPGAPMLVVRSEQPREEGAVAIWFGSEHPIELLPVGWPEWVVPGFLPVAYSQGDKARLSSDALQDGLTGHEPVLEQPTVVRLELWKVPEAPRLLPIYLGVHRPALGLMHATPGVTLQLCPGYSHTVQGIALPR